MDGWNVLGSVWCLAWYGLAYGLFDVETPRTIDFRAGRYLPAFFVGASVGLVFVAYGA
jgi:hypothetical protein